jgi:hypothetical protein
MRHQLWGRRQCSGGWCAFRDTTAKDACVGVADPVGGVIRQLVGELSLQCLPPGGAVAAATAAGWVARPATRAAVLMIAGTASSTERWCCTVCVGQQVADALRPDRKSMSSNSRWRQLVRGMGGNVGRHCKCRSASWLHVHLTGIRSSETHLREGPAKTNDQQQRAASPRTTESAIVRLRISKPAMDAEPRPDSLKPDTTTMRRGKGKDIDVMQRIWRRSPAQSRNT